MKFFYILAVLCVSGCITIESPDHLVSDTIEAGKDVYNSVKEKMSNKPKDNNQTFLHEYIVPDGELIEVSTSNCVDLAVETARKTLNVYAINVKETTTNLLTKDGVSVLECRIVVDNNG